MSIIRSECSSLRGPFDYVISLGQTCLTRFQINRFLVNRYCFPCEDTWQAKLYVDEHRLFGGSQLLDWCVTRSYQKLALSFYSKFARFFDRSDLAIHPEALSVINLRTEVSFDHLFSREMVEGKYVVTEEILNREYDIKREKILYLVNKLRNISGSTLFIISSHHEIPENQLLDIYHSISFFYGFRVHVSLINLYVSGAQPSLSELILSSHQHALILRRPIVANASNDRSHIGDHASWDTALHDCILASATSKSTIPSDVELDINGF